MHGSPQPHHYILGLVSTFKHDDLFALKPFMSGSPPPHLVQFQDISTFKHDDLSALEYLCILVPPHLKMPKKTQSNRLGNLTSHQNKIASTY